MATATRTQPEQQYVATLPASSSQGVRGRAVPSLESAITWLEVVADGLTVMIATQVAFALYAAFHLGRHISYEARFVWTASIVLAVLFVILLDRDGAYRTGNSLLRVKETERILRVSWQSLLLVLPLLFFAAHAFSRWTVGLTFAMVPVFLMLQKHGFYSLLKSLHAKGHGVQNVVIYGAGNSGYRVFSVLARSPKAGMNVVAIVDDDPLLTHTELFAPGYNRTRSVPVIQAPLTSELLDQHDATMAIIAVPTLSVEEFTSLANRLRAAGKSVAFIPDRSPLDVATDYVNVDGLLLGQLRGMTNQQNNYDFSKRAFDLVAAAFLLVLLAPVLLLVALLVKLDSSGPVFFIQERVGRWGKIFQLYKFRSMYVDAPAYSYSPKEGDDRRITRVGRWLRRTSIDELPQLINVFKGEMALVGPRPEMPFIVEEYQQVHRQRLEVTPGITGLWQLSADRAFLIHENIHYDLYYIRYCNFFMDLAILMHTAVFAMRGV
jgi:exopolysaccharide biosynthesis polyprenyl glycosylphosphotransferase